MYPLWLLFLFVSFCFLLLFLVQALWKCLTNIYWMNEQRDMFVAFSIFCFMLLLTFMYTQTLSSMRGVMLGLLFSCEVVSESFVTPWTIACQAPLSMGFPRQESWSGLLFSSPVLGYTLPSPHHTMHTHTHTHTHHSHGRW